MGDSDVQQTPLLQGLGRDSASSSSRIYTGSTFLCAGKELAPAPTARPPKPILSTKSPMLTFLPSVWSEEEPI